MNVPPAYSRAHAGPAGPSQAASRRQSSTSARRPSSSPRASAEGTSRCAALVLAGNQRSSPAPESSPARRAWWAGAGSVLEQCRQIGVVLLEGDKEPWCTTPSACGRRARDDTCQVEVAGRADTDEDVLPVSRCKARRVEREAAGPHQIPGEAPAQTAAAAADGGRLEGEGTLVEPRGVAHRGSAHRRKGAPTTSCRHPPPDAVNRRMAGCLQLRRRRLFVGAQAAPRAPARLRTAGARRRSGTRPRPPLGDEAHAPARAPPRRRRARERAS